MLANPIFTVAGEPDGAHDQRHGSLLPGEDVLGGTSLSTPLSTVSQVGYLLLRHCRSALPFRRSIRSKPRRGGRRSARHRRRDRGRSRSLMRHLRGRRLRGRCHRVNPPGHGLKSREAFRDKRQLLIRNLARQPRHLAEDTCDDAAREMLFTRMPFSPSSAATHRVR
jgi:hypothetical protein